MLTNKKISHLRSELPGWLEFWTRELDRRLNTKNPFLIARAYFDLAHGKLANDEINDAQKLFYNGANALIYNNSVRDNIHIDVYGNGHTFPIYGYLGGRYELGRPLAKRYIDDFRTEMAKPGYLSFAQRIFEDFYLLLGQLIMDDVNEIRNIIQSLDKRLSKYKIKKESLYKPSGLYHKYPLFGKEIVRSLLTKDEEKFSENVYHWSQLKLNALSMHDSPRTLADIELILLYDLALGIGMKPKVETPFIPISIIENGYWNTRS